METTVNTARPDERPHYIRIGDLLRDRIRDNTYPVGSLMPTEGELCAEFTISRYTVREALRRLIDAGLIERKQGSGSRVVAQQQHQNYVHQMRSLNQLFQYATDTRFIIGSMQHATPTRGEFPEIDGIDKGTPAAPWLIINGLRLESEQDVPICYSTILVNNAFEAISVELKKSSGAIYRKIEERFGVEVSEVIQDMTVVPLPTDAAKSLEKKPKTIAARISRRYLDRDGMIILASINYHPAERFYYSMQLKREGRRGNGV
jgi:DNA-binding GntR family transcriptional regulator